MDAYTVLQIFIFGLLGLSFYIKLWKYSISAIMIVVSSAVSLIFIQYNVSLSIYIYILSMFLIVLRATIKPDGEKIIPQGGENEN